MKFLYLFLLAALATSSLKAQDDLSNLFKDDKKTHDPVSATFKTTRLNMGHSIETVGAHQLDFRISHNFGDIGSGLHGFYGMMSSANVRISLEYGITNRLTAGLGRSKGAGAIGELYDGYLKYKLLRQTTDNHIPLSVTLFGSATISGMQSVIATNPTSEAAFENTADRIAYVAQALIARKFSEKMSLQIMPTYVYRNFVAADDQNGFFAIGFGGRYKFTKRSAIVIDYYMPFSTYLNNQHTAGNYYNPLGIGYEIETGGHVFHMSVINTSGLVESDFLTHSNTSFTKNWGFRIGFNISRWFTIGGK